MRARTLAGLLAVALASAGCKEGDRTESQRTVPVTPGHAKRCLQKAGYEVIGGAVDQGGDAPDHELIVSAPARGRGAFVAFYDDLDRAARLEAGIRDNAKRFKGSVTRHGAATVVWTSEPSDTDRDRFSDCLSPGQG